MQPLQRPQPQQQQLKPPASQLLHLQMPMESSSTFMENQSGSNSSLPGGINITARSSSTSCMDINSALNASASSSAPPSPLSISSVSSSASSTESNVGPPSLGVNLRVTGQCSQGGRKYMEDFFSVAYQHSENAKDLEYAFFGIFDGHGGAEAATFAKEHLMMEIINQKLFWSDSDEDVLRAIREGYIATHFAMWREQDKWPKTANGLPSTAGTTATVAFIRHEKIYIGHVGDSGIVLGYQNEGEKCWRSKQLTIDHKPESIAERSRIMRAGGKVVVKSGVPRVVWNRPRNACHRGPIRHNTPVDEIPFLAVARSLGDLWSYNSMCNEFVVSPDPDVRVIKINPKTFRCLVFGTDGLWNVVTPQEAVHTVYQNEFFNEVLRTNAAPQSETNWKNPSQSLVYKALNLWSAKKMRADNTSVVTVILHPPNGSSCNLETSTGNLNNSSKLEASLSDCFGLEYTTQTHGIWEDAVTYREMAEKYLPPAEYQNFNYYDDGDFMTSTKGIEQKTFYENRYEKLSTTRSRFSMPTTIESLEFMCGDKEMERMVGGKSKRSTADIVEVLKEIDIKLDNTSAIDDDDDDDDEDDDGADEEDCEDMCDDDDDEEDAVDEDAVNVETDRTHEHDDNTIVMPNSNEEYAAHFKELTSTNSSSSSYISTFAESYNTLLNDDADGQMSGEVSTSNSSNSYKSHCSSSMDELMQEQQRYQQQCMSEEEGYSLTKLETRREQQRCSTGVQTFRIFQQQQQQEMANDVSTQTGSSTNNASSIEQNYMWQQTAQPLELNSLLQQEREEEQQVELERQMELERLQQQQQQHQIPEDYQNSGDSFVPPIAYHNVSLEEPATVAEHDITIEEEYLFDVAADDASVQINEISSSCLMDIESIKPSVKTRAATKLVSPPDYRQSPMPSSSSSCETIYVDAAKTDTSDKDIPKFIEKLEEIEILHDKPELVIETTSPSTTMMSTRSKHKAKIINSAASTTTPTAMDKRRAATRLHYRNVPNENQQRQQPAKSEQLSTKLTTSPLLRLTSARTAEATTLYNKRQLRSTVTGGNGGSSTSAGAVARAMNGELNRKNFNFKASTSNSSSNYSSHVSGNSNSNAPNNGIIDYAKRTLRTRNSLSKDLKAKTTLVTTSLKRTASNVTTRFLRTQAVSLLNMQQNAQVFIKKSNASSVLTTPKTTTSQHQQPSTEYQRQLQQEQLPLSAATFNLINLRSRQIAGSCQKAVATLPTASMALRPPTTTTATTCVRRNQRSTVKPKMSATTSNIGLPNYCKSMRSQSSASLITPPPPSPKHLNGTTSNITIAVTRARTTSNILLSTAPTTPAAKAVATAATALNSLSSRKRSARNIVENFNLNDNASSSSNTRAPKRLKR